MSDDTNNSVIANPGATLEQVRRYNHGNICYGRGQETAASRGYNAERLAGGVLDSGCFFGLTPTEPYYDNYTGDKEQSYRVEAKSCIDRYPSGGYGRFRFWKRNHDKLMQTAEAWMGPETMFLYFFVVYKIEDGYEEEVGKLVATLEEIDAILDSWSLRDHDSMGETEARDMSWNLLLRELGVSRERFEQEDAIDLTTRTTA